MFWEMQKIRRYINIFFKRPHFFFFNRRGKWDCRPFGPHHGFRNIYSLSRKKVSSKERGKRSGLLLRLLLLGGPVCDLAGQSGRNFPLIFISASWSLLTLLKANFLLAFPLVKFTQKTRFFLFFSLIESSAERSPEHKDLEGCLWWYGARSILKYFNYP